MQGCLGYAMLCNAASCYVMYVMDVMYVTSNHVILHYLCFVLQCNVLFCLCDVVQSYMMRLPLQCYATL